MGINLINLVRRAEQVEELKKEFGHDTHVIVFDGTNSDEALKQIKEITNNRGVNFGVDAVAGTTTELIMKSLAQFGKVLVYGVLNGIELKLNAGEMLFKETSVQGNRIYFRFCNFCKSLMNFFGRFLVESLAQKEH